MGDLCEQFFGSFLTKFEELDCIQVVFYVVVGSFVFLFEEIILFGNLVVEIFCELFHIADGIWGFNFLF